MSQNFDALDDCQLIARFCAGDQEAGSILAARHAPKLLAFIKHFLRKQNRDVRQAEDIFQEVWLALLDEHGHRLQRYDAIRGSLDTYLHKIAWRLLDKRYGQRGSDNPSEVPAELTELADPSANAAEAEAELAELRDDLTPQESRWLDAQTGEAQPGSQPPLSARNQSVLKHRVRRKWDRHFNSP